MDKLLEYTFLEHFYISSKDTYENILCECLNKSKNIKLLTGGTFELITEQSKKQPDVISKVTGYSIDFKMMISESLKEFQSRTAPIVYEITPGVKSISHKPSLKKKFFCYGIVAEI